MVGLLAAEGAEGAEHAATAVNWFVSNAWLIPLLPFVAAAEVGIGLAIVILIYRNRETINVDEVNLLKW